MAKPPRDDDQTRPDDPTIQIGSSADVDKTVDDKQDDQNTLEQKTVADTDRTPPRKTDATNANSTRADYDPSLTEAQTMENDSDTPVNRADVTVDEGQSFTHPSEGTDPGTVAPDAATAQSPVVTRPDDDRKKRERALPERISRYETISLLGEGSFGLVLKSHDPNLDRAVAVKIQKFNVFDSGKTIDRFLREARSAAQLRHPNIIPVFEYGKFAENHFIVYQFIEGTTLKDWVEKTKPTLEQKVEMIARIADALEYAHSSGIVHRDIKPANIMVDAEGRPHVADFGCARRESGEVTHTVDGALMGTPAYMSPEAAAGRANQADGRADIWSLGVMLYELLSGERPFRGKLTQIFHAIQNNPAKPLRQLDRTIPVELETICEKCLQKEPAQRFQTSGELAADLHRWLQGIPIESRRINVFRRTWMWAKRNRAVASLLGTVAAILIVSTIVVSILYLNLWTKQQQLLGAQISSLRTASPDSLEIIMRNLENLGAPAAYRRLTKGLESETTAKAKARFQMAAYRLNQADDQTESQLVDSIARYFPTAEPDELSELLTIVEDDDQFKSQASETLWQDVIEESRATAAQRLRAYCALANLDPESSHWRNAAVQRQVIGDLLSEPLKSNRSQLTGQLNNVRDTLRETVKNYYSSEKEQPATRERAAEILAELFADQFQEICDLGLESAPSQLEPLFNGLNSSQKKLAINYLHEKRTGDDVATLSDRQVESLANVELMLAKLGDQGAITEKLQFQPDPTERTILIHDAAAAYVDHKIFTDALEPTSETDEYQLIGSLAALGQYGTHQLDETERADLKPRLLELFRSHPSSGVHSMSRWLLERWNFHQDVKQVRGDVTSDWPMEGMRWHEDPRGFCFAIFGPGVSFEMGKPPGTSKSFEYRFGIATCEITARQFLTWEKQLIDQLKTNNDERYVDLENQRENSGITESEKPMIYVTWEQIGVYCNSLSSESNIDRPELAFLVEKSWKAEPNKEFSIPEMPAYRLPTGAEWEYACRAGTMTPYSFGRIAQWMGQYGWSVETSDNQLQPISQLKPNDYGMFDMHGNATEWCYNLLDPTKSGYEIRDQSYSEARDEMSVFWAEGLVRIMPSRSRGFRIARTYPSD